MWSNRLLMVVLAVAAWANAADLHAEPYGIGCPPVQDGRKLVDVGLFDGPPAERVELVPRDGGWDLDKPGSRVLPNFTLECTYRGSQKIVTVVLPRSVRVCEFRSYPQVRCH